MTGALKKIVQGTLTKIKLVYQWTQQQQKKIMGLNCVMHWN